MLNSLGANLLSRAYHRGRLGGNWSARMRDRNARLGSRFQQVLRAVICSCLWIGSLVRVRIQRPTARIVRRSRSNPVSKRRQIPLLIGIALMAALALAVYLRKQAPPEVARLLPEADAIVYFDLKPLRTLTHFDLHVGTRAAAYQTFLDATGIDPERDLDEAAFALHRMANPNGPNGLVAYSEVFAARFDGARLSQYLSTQASATESYAGHTIFDIPIDGRTLRVAILGYEMVAASNAPTPEQIHSIIDRYHTAALPFSGSTLLAEHYHDVPLLSQVWGIGKIGLPFADGHTLSLLGIPIPLSAETTFVASVRYLGSLHLRVEEIAANADSAQATTRVAGVALQVLRSLQAADISSDPAKVALGDFLNSATVQQQDNRVVLRAVVPTSLLENLVSGTGPTSQPDGTGTVPAPSQ